MTLDKQQLRNAELLVSRAKIAMLESHPFYAHIVTRLGCTLREGLPMGSVSCTDSRTIFIDPLRFVALPKAEQVTCLAHEQMHCLDGHLWRRGTRDALWANIAQDIYIYHVLLSESFATLTDNRRVLEKILATNARRNPASSYAYDLDDFAGQFWEQIYDAITPPSSQQQPQSSGGQSGDDGDSKGDGLGCYEPQSGQAARDAADQWKQWIREAGTYAKMAGAKAGRWQELVDAATPQIPFETKFYDFLKRGLGGDQAYEAFSRRHISRGLYLPTEVVEQMGETILVNDTSGSRTTEDLAYAYGVFKAWREQYPCRVHVVDVDASVADWRTFSEYDDLPTQWEAKGRGGTSFEPPFVAATERHIEPSLLIYFTDGYNYGDFAAKPPYEVLWVLTGEFNTSFKPPYGEVVKVTHETGNVR